MSATAGFNSVVKATGTPTAMTAEACSLVSGKTYQITSASKRVIDPTFALSVLDNGVAVAAADILSTDMLFGKVTFQASYTPTTPITVTGKYLPLSTIAAAREFEFTDSNMLPESTVFTNTTVRRTATLQSLAIRLALLELPGVVYDGSARSFVTVLQAGERVCIEINIGGSGVLFRAMAIAENVSAGASVAGLLEEGVSFQGMTQSGALGAEHSYWGFGTA